MTIAENLQRIRETIAKTAALAGRNPQDITLLAASKGQSIQKIEAAIDAGQKIFGENYLQEALKKIVALNNPALEWHFIGSIQHNKTRKIAEHFTWVQSVCDPIIAQRLNAQRPHDLPNLNICIEVNLNHEDTKSGVPPDADVIEKLIYTCLAFPRLNVRGLMTIPKPRSSFEEQSLAFRRLADLRQTLIARGLVNLDTLSMGMSQDFEAAIAEGSTIVRIGTAIFGQRL
jgi:PLP dependent protein